MFKLPALSTPAERYRAAKIRDSLYVTEEAERAASLRADADGGVTVSFVDLVQRQRQARLGAGRRAA